MKRYTTIAENQTGVNGTVHIIEPESAVWTISSPLSPDSGTNPEQLLAMSVATCLNASLHYVMLQQGYEPVSTVRVQVELVDDVVGYRFETTAFVWISGMVRSEQERLIELAEAQCPMAKVMGSRLQMRLGEEE